MPEIDSFTSAYIECAFWSSHFDCVGSANVYGAEDLAPETLAQIVKDCRRFQLENYDVLEAEYLSDLPLANVTHAGHDFWLTRNGHGAGFWDGDWSKANGEKLTEACKAFGEVELYVGDDGKIYA